MFQYWISGKELHGLKMYLMTQIKQNVTQSNTEWQNTSVQVLRFSQQCFWRQKSCGIKHNVLGKVVPDVLWDCSAFIFSHQTSQTTCQTTQRYIPQDVSLNNIYNYAAIIMQFTCDASPMYTKLHCHTASTPLLCQQAVFQSHFAGQWIGRGGHIPQPSEDPI
jgi:hypothetical protein